MLSLKYSKIFQKKFRNHKYRTTIFYLKPKRDNFTIVKEPNNQTKTILQYLLKGNGRLTRQRFIFKDTVILLKHMKYN